MTSRLLALLGSGSLVAACSSPGHPDQPGTADASRSGGSGSGSDGSGSAAADAGPDALDRDASFPTAHPRILIGDGDTRTRLEASISANAAAWQHFKGAVDQWVGGATLWGC